MIWQHRFDAYSAQVTPRLMNQFGVRSDFSAMKLACLSANAERLSAFRASDSDTASTSCDASDYGGRLGADDTSDYGGAEDEDEVLSVGCESPPPVTHPHPRPMPQGHSLNFSIDNILRPDFGGLKQTRTSQLGYKSSSLDSKCAPIDLSKESSSDVAGSSPPSKDNSQPMLWPAWVYCTRYSDRPSSGKSTDKLLTSHN